MTKTVLMMSCALGALVLSAGEACAATAAASTTSGASSASTVSEIIVTAEKREQSIQTVPVAVTAFTAQDRNFKGINSVQDMTDFTPGFTYSSQLDRPVMRGLARNNNIFLTDSAVAVYYDDFYSNSTFLAGRDDMLIDQVEVDLGPQGTLYGRNAIGGLINTISKRPTEDWSGELREIIGNYGYIKSEGTVSGPIANHLAFRLSFDDENQTRGYFNNLDPGVPGAGGIRHDPYVDAQLEYKTDRDDLWLDVYGGALNNDRGGPGSLLGLPVVGPYDTSETTPGWLVFNPNFAYSTAAPGSFDFLNNALAPIPGSVVGMVGTGNPALQNIRDYASAEAVDINLRAAYTVTVHFTHHFDGFDLKYVAGYSQYRYNLFSNAFENDLSPITQYQIPLSPSGLCATGFFGASCGPLTVDPQTRFQYETDTKWTSQEITFSSTTNKPLQWIAGAFFYNQSDNNPETWNQPGQPQLATPAQLNVASVINFIVTDPHEFLLAAPNPSQNYLFLDYQDEINSLAGYGQLDWKVTPTLKLTGGVRYTFDWKSAMEEARYIDFSSTVLNSMQGIEGALNPSTLGSTYPAFDITTNEISTLPAQGVTCAVQFPTTGQFAGDATRCLGDHSSAVTGTAGVEWTPEPDTLVYLRYNRGYKAFGLNAGTVGANPESKPEFVDDIEGGIKKTFGRTLVVDADAFYYNYVNDQVPIGVPVGGIDVTEFINIPKSVSDGFELTATWTPIERLNLSLTYGFDHTEILSTCSLDAATNTAVGACFVDAIDPGALTPGARPVGPALGNSSGSVVPIPIGTTEVPIFPQAINGGELPQAPENKVAFNATYTIPFEPGDLILSGTFIWKDKSYSSIFQRSYYEAPSWNQVDLRATWSGHHDRYEVVLYVKNLFNSLGYQAAAGGYDIGLPEGGTLPTQENSYDLTPPRLYGLELHYKF